MASNIRYSHIEKLFNCIAMATGSNIIEYEFYGSFSQIAIFDLDSFQLWTSSIVPRQDLSGTSISLECSLGML